MNKKIILTFLLVFILIIFSSYLFLGLKKEKVTTQNNNTEKVDDENQAEKDEEVWRTDYLKLQSINKLEECEILDESKQLECFMKVLRNYQDDDNFCQYIKPEKIRIRCEEIVTIRNYVKNKDLVGCQKLSEEHRSGCLNSVYVELEDESQCSDLKNEQDLERCVDVQNHKKGIVDFDNKVCEKITDQALRDDCLYVVEQKPEDSDNDGITNSLENSLGLDAFLQDTDRDGLNDYDEVYVYRTNPLIIDTDQDGYNDGEEIGSGFNPTDKK